MNFWLLGLLEVTAADGRPVEIGRGRESGLLALLLLHRNDAISRDRIVDELWSGSPPENARKSVHIYVSRLRKSLGADRIETTPAGYRLRIEQDEVDIDRFERLAAEGRTALEQDDPMAAESTLDEALALWRGEPLADFSYDGFAQAELRRLDELRNEVIADRVDARIARGHAQVVVSELESLIERNPLWERPRAQLMRALYLTGRQVSALELFRATRALLDEELGVEPGLALQRLERAILNHDPELGDVVLPPRFRTVGRRAPLLVLAGGALLIIAALAAAVVLSSGSGGGIKNVAANSVVAIDPAKGEIVADVVVGNRPSRLAATPDTVWAVNSGDGTISQIDLRHPHVINTFGPSSVPTDIVAAGNLLWVGNALAGKGPLTGTNAPATLSRFDATRHAPLGTTRLPHNGFGQMAGRPPETRFVVAGAGVVWSIALDGTVVGVDEAGRVRHQIPLPAASLAYGDHALWVLTQDNHVVRVDPATGVVKQTIAVPSVLTLGGIAAGGGAVWVTSPFQGVLWRIDPGPPSSERTIQLAFGAATIAYGDGAAWVGNSFNDSIDRVDPATSSVRTVASVPAPQDIAVAGDRIWVAAGSITGRTGPLVTSACGHVQNGNRSPDVLIASDFQLGGGDASLSRPAADAVAAVLRRHHFRAGRLRVGLQSCDDASRAAGGTDIGQCIANARADALDRSVIGIVGDDSNCASAEIPILSRAPGGPLALVSPISTSPFLTQPVPLPNMRPLASLYGGGRNFVRTLGADQLQVAADAVLARRLHLHRIGVVFNRLGLTSQAELTWFQAAARSEHVGVVPVEWNGGTATLVSAIRAAHLDGAFLTGAVTQGEEQGVQALAALEHALPAGATIIVTDWLAPWPALTAAGAPSKPVYATLAGYTVRSQLSTSARAVLDALPRREQVPYAVASAVQATEAMLAAIAASDGSRASVTRQLFESGRFDARGDLRNAPVTVFRLERGAHNATGSPYFQNAVVDSVIHAPSARAPTP